MTLEFAASIVGTLVSGIILLFVKEIKSSIRAIWLKLDDHAERIDQVKDHVNEKFVRKGDLDVHIESYLHRSQR